MPSKLRLTRQICIVTAVLAVAWLSTGSTPVHAGGGLTYVVNSVSDSVGDGNCAVGECTLREAILLANANLAGHDMIVFDEASEPQGGYIILLDNPLPSIDGSQPITIDGIGVDVLISGFVLAVESSGLFVRSVPGVDIADVHIRNLDLYAFGGHGILVCAGDNMGPCEDDISNVEIAGVTSQENGEAGISLQGKQLEDVVISQVLVDENHRGIEIHGEGRLERVEVIDSQILGSDFTQLSVLGLTMGDIVVEGNTMTGGGQLSVFPQLLVEDLVIKGNEVVGSIDVGTELAIHQTEISSNIVTGGNPDGITVRSYYKANFDALVDVLIQDNVVSGVERTGIRFVGPAEAGDNNVIRRNTVFENGWDGISVQDPFGFPGQATVTVSRNHTHNNGQLGIDLYHVSEPNPGLTLNDPGDGDSGPNGFLNYPEWEAQVGYTEARGAACPGCLVEVFRSDNAPSGHGEGEEFLTDVTADGAGEFSVPLCDLGLAAGEKITATATDSGGNTSEFSQNYTLVEDSGNCATPTPTASPTPTPTPDPTPTPVPTPTDGPTSTPSAKAVHGDTDCDNDVDAVDGLLVLRDVAGFPPSKCIHQGDVDCDGDRDSVDALGILRHVAALPPLQQQEPCPDIGSGIP